MRVVFYNFSKRLNSTKQPTGASAVLTVDNAFLKEQTTIESPTLIIDLHGTSYTTPNSFNYCYIPEFNRFYYRDTWTSDSNLWEGSFKTDVLATFKSSIGDSTKYVARCASASSEAANSYSAKINDAFYATTNEVDIYEVTGSSPWNISNFSDGSYVIISAGGANNVYNLSPTAFQSFCLALFDDGAVADAFRRYLDAGGSVNGVIQNIFWLPFTARGTATTSVRISQFNVPVSAGAYLVTSPTITSNITFENIPMHPQAPTRGYYLRLSPYSNYSVCIPPFGNIDVPADIVSSNTALSFGLRSDISTGDSILTLLNLNSRVSSWSANISVPLFVSFTRMNHNKIAQFALTAAASGVGIAASAMSGNYAGVAIGAINLANTAIQNADTFEPVTSSIGSVGSFAALYGTPTLTARHKHVVNANWSEVGRPYCKTVTLNTLSGFIQCLEGNVDMNGNENEKNVVAAALTQGFFYE